MLLEKTDRLNQLSIINEQLERNILEKETSIANMTLIIKEYDEKIKSNKIEKDEQEKVKLI